MTPTLFLMKIYSKPKLFVKRVATKTMSLHDFFTYLDKTAD